MSEIEIRADNVPLGNADTLNIKSPLLVSVSNSVANIVANTSKITELPSITDATGEDILVIVTNATSTPVTERINVSDLFGNIVSNAEFNANVLITSNIYVSNSSTLYSGNSTINSIYSSSFLSIANSQGTANVQAGLFVTGNTSINSTIIAIGANVRANSSTITVGNSTINTTYNSTTIQVSNSTVDSQLTVGELILGNSTVNVVANSSSVKISNSSSNTLLPLANSEQFANGQYFLNANGSWTTVTGAIATPGGANTNIQYNDSGSIEGSNSLSFNNTTNTLSITNSGSMYVGNSTVNTYVNSTFVTLSNSTISTRVSINSIELGNSSSNLVTNNSLIRLSNSSYNISITPLGITSGLSSINSTIIAVGSNVLMSYDTMQVVGTGTTGNSTISASYVFVGNSITSAEINKEQILVGSSTDNVAVNASSITLQNSSISFTIVRPTEAQYDGTNVFLAANGEWVTYQPVVTIEGSSQQIQFNASGSLAGSNGLIFDSSANVIYVGNTTSNMSANSTVIRVGNSTHYALMNTTTFYATNTSTNSTLRLPTVTEANGKFFLNGNGSWTNINTPGLIELPDPEGRGSNTQVQFNDSNYSNGSTGFTFNKTTNNVIVGNNITAYTLTSNSGWLLVGNSTVNVYANSSMIRLANSSSNTRITVPTALQYANDTMFLHANGSWVDLNDVFIGGAEGAEGTIQYAAASGEQTGNSQIRIVSNGSIVLANATSNTKISIPTVGEREDRHHVLHANGEWAHVRKILRINYNGWFFGRSPQVFLHQNWTFIPNTTFSATASDWTTIASGTVRIDGDSDSPGSTYTALAEGHCHIFGAFFRTNSGQWPGWGVPFSSYHQYFDNYWWYWNDYDSEVEFRFILNDNPALASPSITKFTSPYKKHTPCGTLAYTYTTLGEGYYVTKLQARLVNPGSDPAVAVKARKVKITQ